MSEQPVPAGTDDTTLSQPVLRPDGYKEDDLVYVDPKKRIVVGLVEWSNSGRPKSLPMKEEEEENEVVAEGTAKTPEKVPEKKDQRFRKKRIRYYPWGTYRSMKRIYKLEGKVIEQRGNQTLDEVLPKALNEAFWD